MITSDNKIDNNKIMINSKSPLRISFSGGGTDIHPYAGDFGGLVLNTTINKYVYTSLVPRDDKCVVIKSHDYNFITEYHINDKVDIKDDLFLVKTVIKEMDIKNGFELYIHSEVPLGSGLGASSALVVGLIGLLHFWQTGEEIEPYICAEKAYYIERNIACIKGGKQDQYASAFGGMNLITFGKYIAIVYSFEMEQKYYDELEQNLLLCFVGDNRVNADSMDNQILNYKENVQYLHKIKDLTNEIINCLQKGDLDKFGILLNETWESKKKLSSGISNDYIDKLHQIGISSGSLGAKICGAGSGGHLLFYCPTGSKSIVAENLIKAGGKIINFNFEKKGMTVWKI